jgi:hypothetical protein
MTKAERKRYRYATDPEFRARLQAAVNRYHARHRDEINAYQRARRQLPEYRPAVLAAEREKSFRVRYGITTAEYEQMLAAQGGVCAICKRKPSGRRLGVDHCHLTKRIRRLLCSNCNVGLGFFCDDPDRMERAAEYLEAWLPSAGRRVTAPRRRTGTRRR